MEVSEYLSRYGVLARALHDKNPFLSKSDLVYSLVLDDILSGRLVMGETIQQDMLAQALEVSRSPVREALTRLTDEGFCAKASNGAFRVKKVTVGECIDFSEFRISLEVGAIRLATRNATSEDIREMKHAVIQLENAMKNSENVRTVLAADFDFHRAICLASKNEFFVQAYEAIQKRMLFIQAAVINESNYHNMISKHKQIFAAIERRDEDAAQECMRSHLSFYAKNLHRLQ